MPKMLSGSEETAAKTVESLTFITVIQGVMAYLIGLLTAAAIEPLLADLQNMTFSIHLMAISITRPALLAVVLNTVIEMTTFDILPIDIPYDWWSGAEPKGATDGLSYCKYESNSFIRNIGSVIVFFWLYLYFVFVLWFLSKISGADSCLNKFKAKYSMMGVLNLVTSSALAVVVSTLILIKYHDKRDGVVMQYANIICAVVMMIYVCAIPFYILITYKRQKWLGYDAKIKKEVRKQELILD
jgi:hypothetical protein